MTTAESQDTAVRLLDEAFTRAAPTAVTHVLDTDVEDDSEQFLAAVTSPSQVLAGGRQNPNSSIERCKYYASAAAEAANSISHTLVLKPTAEICALLAVPMVMWWLAVLMGACVYEGLPKGQKVKHNMLWFDRGIFRPAGAALPFLIILLRAAAHAFGHSLRHGAAGLAAAVKVAAAQAAGRAGYRRHSLKLGTLLPWCLLVYVGITLVRAIVYQKHLILLNNRVLEFHILSDHIFLAASILSCLHLELLCLVSDMQHLLMAHKHLRTAVKAPKRGQERVLLALLGVVFIVTLFLYVCTAADMYYTAKYFHFPLESCCTALVVLLLFQAPLLCWLHQHIKNRAGA